MRRGIRPMRSPGTALPALALLSACASPPGTVSTAHEAEQITSRAAQGLSFARERCATCHAIEPLRISPNPEAPAFSSIAGRERLTYETLQAFLQDSHNYPVAMDFTLAPDHAEDLAAYLLTLRAD